MNANTTTEFCERCGEKLNPERIVWLELNRDTRKFHKAGVPEAESQGWFPFGESCAKATDGKRIKRIRAKVW